ncbi:TIGR02680 family protein [Tahibacter soli]|uniref:TIGR02680 family protein n=1 Tax=Tahibacter soli TaxID=2983605 RepID=A0A9X4BKN1_9GAMM|nr:TIGR02680 family protein [Tahibacter soli]MDC8014442.1 TIGR02680 family protein [Tahibacter soli]
MMQTPASGALRPPRLPQPSTARWQPLRIGLVELFRYDSEEFWFHEGRLLLRGNNGTGKSKVLSLTLPFLLDANLRPSRIEPDGDAGKRMAWNLLLGTYDRRIGYAWIEFGRRDEDGTTHFMTLGAGLSAAAARPHVDSWFFILDGEPAARIGEDFWLLTSQRSVLTRERLREAIEGRGQVFDKAEAYRRAVDERLFRLGKRYGALMDTLIQLRQPQLSKKPDETGLSNALSEALPPMEQRLLGDVAEALNHLEEERRELDELKQLAKAVGRFDERYRIYAGTLTRRQVRELRQAQTTFDNASRQRAEAQAHRSSTQDAKDAATDAREAAEARVIHLRDEQHALLSDPAMTDAKRLDDEKENAAKWQREAEAATRRREAAARRRDDEVAETARATQEAVETQTRLAGARSEGAVHAGAAEISTGWATHPLVALAPLELVDLAPADIDAAQTELLSLVADRQGDVETLRRRHREVDQARDALLLQRQSYDEKRAVLDDTAERRRDADAAFERACDALIEAWAAFHERVIELRVDVGAQADALAEWTRNPTADNPARIALREALLAAGKRHAVQEAELDAIERAVHDERSALSAERQRLNAGSDLHPPAPPARDAAARLRAAGMPLWKLVDFRPTVDARAKAGLEGALEGAGLLDAWVTPDGRILGADAAEPWHDVQLLARTPIAGGSLADWLQPAIPDGGGIAPALIERLLAGIAVAANDPVEAEAWVSPSGRYRIGPLSGSWIKAQAQYIGYAAREQARLRRIVDIDARLDALAQDLEIARRRRDALEAARGLADEEWRGAPSDDALHAARLSAAAASATFREARTQFALAEDRWRNAEQTLHAAHGSLERDARDLRLPAAAPALTAIDGSLAALTKIQGTLVLAVREWRRLIPGLRRQQARRHEAAEQFAAADDAAATAQRESQLAQTRYDVLLANVGVKVETLQKRLADVNEAVRAGERALKAAEDTLRTATEAFGFADGVARGAEAALAASVAARANAVARLRQFAANGLLPSALPDIDIPPPAVEWTIDPALNFARRVEQQLAHIKDDDASWERIQRGVSEDLQELQRALTTLGHRETTEINEWGLVVHIVYGNQPERPDRLIAALTAEVAQRGQLLTEQEREVLENYLQAEIAIEVQRSLQAADRHVDAINRELEKRPTSTGVRYRLQWQTLPETEGAPIGFDRARARLLNTSSDLWTSEDKRAIGTMLQQRIAAERERADADVSGEAGNLSDQLARALDYRRWHRFRVERLQDGHWRKLSGPASSGERALGLTVPLFAAIASFYGQGSYALAPRLMLLDEAFAGIDDAARAHCMGLIREFDLDFVITSEREWACYAELPGVSICQLQKLPDIDAIYVSRWTWDGRARRRETDPDRRFPST